MIPGFTGNLVTEYFAEEFFEELFGAEIDRGGAAKARARLLRQRRGIGDRLGPVCGPRQIFDLVTVPVAEALGYCTLSTRAASDGRLLVSNAGDSPIDPVLATTAWGEGLEGDKRHSVIYDNSKIKRLVPGYCATVSWREGVHRCMKNILKHAELQPQDADFDKWCDGLIGIYDKALDEAKRTLYTF
jgi:hypothetical protein